MIKCGLNIDHSGIQDKYKKDFVFCNLVNVSGKMVSQGCVCLNCCIVISFIDDAIRDLMLTSQINRDDLKRDGWKLNLSEKLQHYADAVEEAFGSHDWVKILEEHKSCHQNRVDGSDRPIIAFDYQKVPK